MPWEHFRKVKYFNFNDTEFNWFNDGIGLGDG